MVRSMGCSVSTATQAQCGTTPGTVPDLPTNPAKHGRRHDERNPKALTVPL
jgi:hypothetical protein